MPYWSDLRISTLDLQWGIRIRFYLRRVNREATIPIRNRHWFGSCDHVRLPLARSSPANGDRTVLRLSRLQASGLNLPTVERVGSLAKKGAMWSILMMVSRNVITVLGTAVLARLLTPEDFGIIGMVATLTALLQAFSELGLSWATLQSRELSKSQVDNLFWINVITGTVIWWVALILAPFLASFYGEPRLAPVVMVLSSTFLIGGVAVQPSTLLKRQMEFGKFSAIVIAATTIGVLVGIGCAAAGMGYWAIVAQAISIQSCRMVFALLVTGYRPNRFSFGVGTKRLLVFSGNMAIIGVLTFAARSADNVIVGRQFGAVELGFYSRAYFLMSLPTILVTSALTSVMIPALSSLVGDPHRLAMSYRRALQATATIAFPLAAMLFVAASGLIRLVYGPQWDSIVAIVLSLTFMGLRCLSWTPLHGSLFPREREKSTWRGVLPVQLSLLSRSGSEVVGAVPELPLLGLRP